MKIELSHPLLSPSSLPQRKSLLGRRTKEGNIWKRKDDRNRYLTLTLCLCRLHPSHHTDRKENLISIPTISFLAPPYKHYSHSSWSSWLRDFLLHIQIIPHTHTWVLSSRFIPKRKSEKAFVNVKPGTTTHHFQSLLLIMPSLTYEKISPPGLFNYY